MSNSVIIASFTALGVVFASSFAAYAFARFKFPLRKTAFYGLLATQMMPALTNIIPLYMLLQVLKLLNTRTALIIVYTGVNLPLSIWIMTGFFQSLPIEVEEAAMIDGCNRFNIFTRIALPLALPGLAAVAILAFVMAWNEFVLALTFLSSQSLKPYQFGLYDIMVREMMQYQPHSLLNAAAVLGLIPSFIAYLFIQRGFMTGITRGAIK